jgi:zinc protease
MFDVHRIRRWRIGSEAILRGFTRDAVLSYYRNLYRASNTILVIAGDVDADEAFALAERYYGGMPAGEPLRDAGADEPERRGFRYREMDGDIAQTHIELGWRTPGTLHADTAALDVLAVVLGQGRASRLYRQVRDTGAAASISAYNYTPTSVGIFGIGMETAPADTAVALERTSAVLLDVLERGVSEAEVERARNILEARLLRRLETVEGQANLIADWQALGDWRLAGDYLRRIMGTTPQRLREVARRYLDPDTLTLLVYRPRTAPVFAGDAHHLRRTLFPAFRTASAAARPGRLQPQRVEDGVHFYALDGGGAHVIVKPRATAPLVSVALYCRGGVVTEQHETAGLTGLMARTSVKGTRTRSGAQLAEESEALGASISPGVGADLLHWSSSLPGRHLESGLDLLLDAALEPTFAADDAERERKIALIDLEQIRDDMHRYPTQLAFAAAFPGHPYGFALEHLESAVRDADLERLRYWHAERVLRGAPHVLVVGDITDPDAVAALVAGRLAGRIEAPRGLDISPAAWGGSAEGAVRVAERDKAQTALALVFPGPPRNHPDVYALQLLSSAIAGLGGRLFEELRSRRSLAYAISAMPIPRWVGGAFVAYIGTSPEREQEAREAMLHELLRTANEPLSADELERARRYMIGAWQIRQQTHSRQLTDLAYALLIGEGLAELRDFEGRIRGISAEQVQAAAARWLRQDSMVEGVVRGSSAAARR